MKIRVIGRSHLQGTSKKTGRPYDFIQVHNGKAFGVEGLAALTLFLDPKANLDPRETNIFIKAPIR